MATWRVALAVILGSIAGVPSGAQQVDSALLTPLKWRMIGPYRGGRTKAAVGIPSKPNVFFIGVTNGGVWKTDDYARTWLPIFDDQPTGSIGAIAIAPSNPDIMYVGTGEGLQRPDLSTGDGIYKSTDGGKTWRHTGQLRDGQQIPQIIVDPRNSDRLFVAVLGHPYGPNEQRGIFRSLDGARTFEKVLYQDENTGGIDVAFDPSDANTIYAVLWESRQGPWENGVFTGPGSTIHKSTDGGATWRRVMTGIPTFEQDGLGRIGITVAPSMPNRLFATVEARRGAGLYRSDDGGERWYLVNSNSRVTNRASDFAEVKVHPTNPDVVFTGSIVVWKSIDGGKTFTGIRGAPGGDDYHRIWINPQNPDIILIAADQGAIVTTNGGATWSTWYNQPTAQLYHVTADNAFPYRVCGGQQESGSACVSSRGDWGRVTVRDWTTVGVEEYGYVAPDPLDPDIVYGGKVSRYDRRTGQTANIGPRPVRTADYRVIRTMPILFSPIDKRTLYFASNVLWKTTTGGQSWTQISPDLTRRDSLVPPNVGKYANSAVATARHPGVIYTIAPSPLELGRIWVGTDDGLIHLTKNGGATWSDVTPAALRDKPWSKVSLMDASHFDVNTAYAAVNTIRLDDLRPHIYRTRDGGKSWTRIVTGIDSGATINVVREDPQRRGLLFAGSETHVWVSFDDGDHWQSLRLNMPASSIRDLIIKDDDVAVGTHGRGIWILDNITLLRQLAAGAPASDAVLYKPALAYRVRWNMNTDTPLPPDEPTAENPPDGATIDYYLPSGVSGVVSLEVRDSAGALVRRYASDDTPERIDSSANIPMYWPRQPRTLSAAPGMHRFVWDLHYPRPKVFNFSYPIAAVPGNTELQPLGPWVLPGRYTLRLTANGRTYTQPIAVRMDPRVKTPAPGIVAMQRLSMRVTEGLALGYDAIVEARAASARLRDLPQRLTALEQRVNEVLGAGGGFGAPAGAMSLTRAHGALVTLYDALQDADVTPTAQTRQQVDEYTAAMKQLVTRWQSVRADYQAQLR